MTRARTLADLGSQSLATDAEATAAASAAAAAVPTGSKNLLYNGAMQVAQRGTSTAGITTGGYYTADRWQQSISGLGTWTQSIENDAPTGSGFSKSLKMFCTTADAAPAASDYFLVEQKLEGQDVQRIGKGTSSAQQLTLSFSVKTNITGTYVVFLQDYDNNRSVSATYSISASGTWERKTITFPADLTGVLDNDNAGSLGIRFVLGAGSDWTSGTLDTSWGSLVLADLAPGQTNLAAATNNYWQITGVQLEVGDTATDFEHLPFGVELARCQRYYEHSFVGSPAAFGLNTGQGVGGYHPTSAFRGGGQYSVVKRATPTFTIYDHLGTTGRVSYYTTSWNGGGSVFFAQSGATGYYVGHGVSGSVETQFAWTADAEL